MWPVSGKLVLPMFFFKLKTKTSKNPTLKRIEIIKLTRPVHVLKTEKKETTLIRKPIQLFHHYSLLKIKV